MFYEGPFHLLHPQTWAHTTHIHAHRHTRAYTRMLTWADTCSEASPGPLRTTEVLLLPTPAPWFWRFFTTQKESPALRKAEVSIIFRNLHTNCVGGSCLFCWQNEAAYCKDSLKPICSLSQHRISSQAPLSFDKCPHACRESTGFPGFFPSHSIPFPGEGAEASAGQRGTGGGFGPALPSRALGFPQVSWPQISVSTWKRMKLHMTQQSHYWAYTQRKQ